MAIAVDDTVARWAGSPNDITTQIYSASFTPPVGSLIVACVEADQASADSTDTLVSLDSTGQTLVWRKHVERQYNTPGSAKEGYAAIFTAPVVSAVATTVGVGFDTANRGTSRLSAKLRVVTGHKTVGSTTAAVSNEGNNISLSAGTTVALGSNFTPTAGRHITLIAIYQNASALTVTWPTAWGTAKLQGTYFNATEAFGWAWATVENVGAVASNGQITLSGSSSAKALYVIESVGIAKSGAYLGSNGMNRQSNPGTGAGAITAAIAPTKQPALILGLSWARNSSNWATNWSDTGTTAIWDLGGAAFIAKPQNARVTSTSTKTLTWTTNAGTDVYHSLAIALAEGTYEGVTNSGNYTTDPQNAALTSSAAGRLFGAACDWGAAGVATSTDTINSATYGTDISAADAFKASDHTAGASTTINFDPPGTPSGNWALLEIIAAPSNAHNGTGTLTAQNSTAAGAGVIHRTSSGALTSGVSTLVGAGHRGHIGTGAATITKPTSVGVGTTTTTVALNLQMIDEAGDAAANLTGVTVLIWRDIAATGVPDVVLTNQTTNAGGTTHWVFPRAGLGPTDKVKYFAYHGTPDPSIFTAGCESPS